MRDLFAMAILLNTGHLIDFKSFNVRVDGWAGLKGGILPARPAHRRVDKRKGGLPEIFPRFVYKKSILGQMI
jgi:hypothetical protein